METMPDRITPNLWFDTEAEEAATFYADIFPNSRIVDIQRWGPGGMRPEGTVLIAVFELDGQKFVALNGGPEFKPNEAVSFEIRCQDQDEVDHYWERLAADGGSHGPCGWLKDKYGFSWQVIPEALPRLLSGTDPETAQRVMAAMLKMGKIDVAELERAAAGETTTAVG